MTFKTLLKSLSKIIAIVFILLSCKSTDKRSAYVEKVSYDPSYSDLKNAKKKPIAIIIDLKMNVLSLHKNGKETNSWKIASADHPGTASDGLSSLTPTGVFYVEALGVCPPWKPTLVKDNGETLSEEESRKHYAEIPHVYKGCADQNPLGHYAIWFHKEAKFAIHGSHSEEVFKAEHPNERRVEGGCAKLPNKQIKKLFYEVLAYYVAKKVESEMTAEMIKEQDKKPTHLRESIEIINIKNKDVVVVIDYL